MTEYPQKAWCRTSKQWVPIEIDYMRVEDAEYWHANIQPAIDKTDRADRLWDWEVWRGMLPFAQSLVGRRCLALTIHVQTEHQRGMPAGMLLLIESYPWLAPRPWDRFRRRLRRQRSTFTWFLSSAPHSRLRELGVPEPPQLGAVLIDTALVASVNHGHEGRMWLHAAPDGGQKLFDFYDLECGLGHVNPGFRVPSITHPVYGLPSDGRHFFATHRIAKKRLSALNSSSS
jgi:hypothetical protein